VIVPLLQGPVPGLGTVLIPCSTSGVSLPDGGATYAKVKGTLSSTRARGFAPCPCLLPQG